jgi:cellulose synthase/poly-beta-1,6-N-acetylglucosamine synthase-like glycosyltransferase
LDPMIPISIVISTKNEELNIQKCISCCNEFMEIIVVDSMSTDSTKTICNELGIPVVDFSFLIIMTLRPIGFYFLTQMNFLLLNLYLKLKIYSQRI